MDEVSRVREKIDIAELISQYIPLKKAGRNFKAPCPFHNEKTPSFVVSPERQIWHCFGCGKGGDAFTFLMEYENMEFVEALRTLAKKAGIVLLESGFDKGVATKKEKIYSINKLTLDFYQYLLTKHNVGKAALDYLIRQRELTPSAVSTFSLVFSPGIGNALCNYLIN
ncbi:MAG: DNA primase, partial [Candidatus Levybacteria bacterium]|nr:DNA primase [Candidatus Levybacteria bacterium]